MFAIPRKMNELAWDQVVNKILSTHTMFQDATDLRNFIERLSLCGYATILCCSWVVPSVVRISNYREKTLPCRAIYLFIRQSFDTYIYSLVLRLSAAIGKQKYGIARSSRAAWRPLDTGRRKTELLAANIMHSLAWFGSLTDGSGPFSSQLRSTT